MIELILSTKMKEVSWLHITCKRCLSHKRLLWVPWYLRFKSKVLKSMTKEMLSHSIERWWSLKGARNLLSWMVRACSNRISRGVIAPCSSKQMRMTSWPHFVQGKMLFNKATVSLTCLRFPAPISRIRERAYAWASQTITMLSWHRWPTMSPSK